MAIHLGYLVAQKLFKNLIRLMDRAISDLLTFEVDCAPATRPQPHGELRRQKWPFHQVGCPGQKTYLDIWYRVQPAIEWYTMKAALEFIRMSGPSPYHSPDHVDLQWADESIEYKPKNFVYIQGIDNAGKCKIWIGYIIELRVDDVSDCFLRIFWLYRPDDLPKGTLCAGELLPEGRQPYHGHHEMIISNHSKTSVSLSYPIC